MIKPFLTAAAIAIASAPAIAAPYDDTVTFNASVVCAELTGTQNPTTSNDEDWKAYLQCVEAMHYFNTKYK